MNQPLTLITSAAGKTGMAAALALLERDLRGHATGSDEWSRTHQEPGSHGVGVGVINPNDAEGSESERASDRGNGARASRVVSHG